MRRDIFMRKDFSKLPSVGLISSLLCIALVSCSVNKGASKGLPKSDDALLIAIVSLAKRGHVAVCEPLMIAETLGIMIDAKSSTSTDVGTDKEIRSEKSSKLVSIDLTDAVLEGTYYRFASNSLSYCQIGVRLKPNRLCQSNSTFEKAFGQKMQLSTPSPHGPPKSSRIFQLETSGLQTVIGLGDHESNCANEFTISSKGLWK
jgi:hypothetical protein